MIEKITSQQFKILWQLLELNREVPRRELAEHLGVPSSSLNLPLTTMNGELIHVSQAPGRGNSHVVSLTERGRWVIEGMRGPTG